MCQKERTPWVTLNAAKMTRPSANEQTSSDDGEISILNTIQTNFGDVLAQALSQKKERKTAKSNEGTKNANLAGNGNKKSKKSKKMLPLYSTGMNFSGN